MIKVNNKIILKKGKDLTYIYDLETKGFHILHSDYKTAIQNCQESASDKYGKDLLEEQYAFMLSNLDSKKGFSVTYLATETCNLKCSYCFENAGTFNNNNKKKVMSLEQYVNSYEKISKEKKIEIIEFFGGEPLIGISEIELFCKYLAQKYESIPQLGIITNGTLLTPEIIDFLKQYNFVVTVSLDGPKNINDINRVSDSINSVFDNIIEKIGYLRERDLFNACEATLTYEILLSMSKEEMYEYIDFFNYLGCHAVGIIFARDSKANNLVNDDIIKEKLREFYTVYINYVFDKLLMEDSDLINHIDIIGTIMGFISKSQISLCGAGINKVLITVNGDIYPCQMYYSIREKQLGSIDNLSYVYENVNKMKKEYIKRISIDCLKCQWVALCNAISCPGQNLAESGSESETNELLCYANKIRNEIILDRLFAIVTNKKVAKLFINNLTKCIKLHLKGFER